MAARAVGCWVDDMVQAELELIAKVVAGLENVSGSKFRKIRIFISWHSIGIRYCQIIHLLARCCGQTRFLYGESVDERDNQCAGVSCHLHRQSAGMQASENGIVMLRRLGSRCAYLFHET